MRCRESYLKSLKPGDDVDLYNPYFMRRYGKVVSNNAGGLRIRFDAGGGKYMTLKFGRRTGHTRSARYRIESPRQC